MGTKYKGTKEEIMALDGYVKLSRAAESVGRAINTHLSDYDLTISQFGTLEALYHLGPLPSGELGDKILKSSGNMTFVIDNLIKRNLVYRQRREDDRRCVEIHLTEDGRSLIHKIWPNHLAGVVRAMSALTPAEQTQLATLCRTLGLNQVTE
ncbi:MAG: MarR family transcriptional regulator [Candidatus Promineifilaceae bacterium]